MSRYAGRCLPTGFNLTRWLSVECAPSAVPPTVRLWRWRGDVIARRDVQTFVMGPSKAWSSLHMSAPVLGGDVYG